MTDLKRGLGEAVSAAFASAGLSAELGRVTPSDRPDLADFQCNGALAAAKQARRDPREIAAGVVAELATNDELAELQTLHEALEAAVGERDRFFALNEQFHMRVLELARNRWREQMVADLRKVMKLNRHNSLLKTGRIQESLAEHRAIVAALAQRNAALAVQRMREHFQSGLEAAA